MAVDVEVVAPGVVAALVSGSDAVAVINAGKRARNLRRWRPISRKLDELIESEVYERDIDLLERIVAMLTKLIDP